MGLHRTTYNSVEKLDRVMGNSVGYCKVMFDNRVAAKVEDGTSVMI